MIPPPFLPTPLNASPAPTPKVLVNFLDYEKEVASYFAHLPWVVSVNNSVAEIADINYFARYLLLDALRFTPWPGYLKVTFRRGN